VHIFNKETRLFAMGTALEPLDRRMDGWMDDVEKIDFFV
jgi:hypothetical protein